MKWKIKTFDELTTMELYQIMQIRVDVFVVEQTCVYRELDGLDRDSYHVYATNDSGIAAYARILPPGLSYKELSIGRVLVSKDHRRSGLGSELIERTLTFIFEELNERVIKIQAQEYLLSFYRSFGFEKVSDVYLDEGIPHIDMILKLERTHPSDA